MEEGEHEAWERRKDRTIRAIVSKMASETGKRVTRSGQFEYIWGSSVKNVVFGFSLSIITKDRHIECT